MDRTKLRPALDRWSHLLVHRLIDDLKPLGLALGVVTGLGALSLILFQSSLLSGSGRSLWPLFIVLASMVTAGSAFRTMHEGRSSTDWLLWPASALEKYAAALVESVVVVPLGLTLASVAASALLAGLELLVTGQGSGIWLPWAPGLSAEAVGGFLVLFLVLLTGSAAFRKHALWKTALVILGALTLGSLVLAGVLGALGVSDGIRIGDGSWSMMRFGGHGRRWVAGPLAAGAVPVLVSLWFYLVLPAFCLAFGWAKVREKEARDEVQ